MNNEPVAWMLVDEINGDYMLERHPSGDYDWIPLYTHPVKELDRELLDKTIIDQQNEIKDLRKNLDIALMIVNKPKLTDEEIEIECKKAWGLHEQDQLNLAEVFKFARAILRKAQEK